jgi:hypothetical protein
MTATNQHQIRVIRYSASDRPVVRAFADVEIDGTWRANGINLLRDGSIKPGQLTPLINHRRVYIPSIEILDANLRESLITAIRDAIMAHLRTLPPEQREKPPRPSEPRKPDERPQKAAKPQNAAPAQAKPAPTTRPPAPIKPKAMQATDTKRVAEKPRMPPPVRLLANFSRRP